MALTRIEHLLACLGEECGELQQEVGKCLRFGYDETNRKHGGRNIDNLKKEATDVMAMFDMLSDETKDLEGLDMEHFDNKQAKVQHYIDEMNLK